MNERIKVELTELDIAFLRKQKQDIEQWQFLNRGKVRTSDQAIDLEVELRFINRLLTQLPK